MSLQIATAAMGITTRAIGNVGRMLEWFGETVLRLLEGKSQLQVVLLILVLDALLIAVGLLLPNAQGSPMYYFNEFRFLTFLSVLQLATVSALALQVYLTREKDQAEVVSGLLKPQHLWLVIAAGFAYMAVDDLIMIHEIIDKLIHVVGGIEETSLTDHLDDAIIVLYVIGALGVLYVFRHELLAFRECWLLFSLAFFFLGLTVAFDLGLTESLPSYFGDGWLARILRRQGVIEEICKLVSECFFVAALYACVLKARTIGRPANHTETMAQT